MYGIIFLQHNQHYLFILIAFSNACYALLARWEKENSQHGLETLCGKTFHAPPVRANCKSCFLAQCKPQQRKKMDDGPVLTLTLLWFELIWPVAKRIFATHNLLSLSTFYTPKGRWQQCCPQFSRSPIVYG